MPNAGSSLHHENTPTDSSQKIPCLTAAFTLAKVPSLKSHVRSCGKMSWGRHNPVLVSRHGSITSCCRNLFLGQLKHSTGSATQQVFGIGADTILQLHLLVVSFVTGQLFFPTPCCGRGAQWGHYQISPTTAQLGQDPEDPCETDGKDKNMSLNQFPLCLLCLSIPISNARA